MDSERFVREVEAHIERLDGIRAALTRAMAGLPDSTTRERHIRVLLASEVGAVRNAADDLAAVLELWWRARSA